MALQLSNGELDLLDGFHTLLAVHNRTFTVTADSNPDNVGVSFSAVPVPQAEVIILANELGEDGRDWQIIEVERPAPGSTAWTAASLQMNATLTDGVNTWRVMRQTDNATDIVIRLWLAQVVPGKDT